MDNRIRVVSLLLILSSVAWPAITFERTWGFYDANNYAYGVEQTNDDGYILTFAGHDSAHQEVGGLLKADSLGNLEWWRQYYSPTNHGAVPNGLCATFDHGYVLVGLMGGSGVSDGWAVKADSVGDTLWTYVHAGPGYDYFWSVAPTADSGCIIAGKLSEGSDNGMALLKLSQDGRREWLKIYCRQGKTSGGGSVWQTGDRSYFYVGGIHDDTSDIYDWYLVKTDSVGETLWTAIYRPDIPGYRGSMKGSACRTADGGCALCGTDAFGHGYVSYLAKLDSLGHGLLARSFFRDTIPGPHERIVGCVQETPDRGFIIVGLQDPGPSQVLVARFDSSGDTLWTRGYDGVDPSVSDQGYWVVNTRDGGFAVSGIADYRPAYLIKTDSMGVVYTAVGERGPGQLRDDALTAEPNPFHRVVNIRCGAGLRELPQLSVYDAAGRMVRRLPSAWSTSWDGRDGSGQLLPAGTYFVEACARSERRLVRVLLMR
jgi:hypothetical protein